MEQAYAIKSQYGNVNGIHAIPQVAQWASFGLGLLSKQR